MTGREIETWIATRQRPDGQAMTTIYAAESSGCHRTSLWRWVSNADAEVTATRALRDFIDWMREYDRAHKHRRTAGASRTPKPVVEIDDAGS